MANLIDKLNVLVKAGLHGVLDEDSARSRRRKKPASPARLGKDIDQEIAALRQQTDQALEDEDRLSVDIQALQPQIDSWDQQADQALEKGDEATARYAIRQMQLLRQRQTMQEADLAQHRFSTSELIQRVNDLEAVVAQARAHPPASPAQDTDSSTETLSARLRQARQQVSQGVNPPHRDAPPAEVDEKVIDDDLAQRRARLSQ